MRIGTEKLKLKDIKPGTILTVVNINDIYLKPGTAVYKHRENKKSFLYQFAVGMEQFCGLRIVVKEIRQNQTVISDNLPSGWSFSVSMFNEIDINDPEIIWGYYEVRTKK